MIGTADFSPCGVYRYGLTRRWAEGDSVLWIMLNPSTADADFLDPTIRRCVGFSTSWNYAGLEVANLFARRSTDPKVLYTDLDPVGPRNDDAIVQAVRRCRLVVIAWGAHGGLRDREAIVLRLLAGLGVEPICLGVTKNGHPRHPLYLRADTERVPHRANE